MVWPPAMTFTDLGLKHPETYLPIVYHHLSTSDWWWLMTAEAFPGLSDYQ